MTGALPPSHVRYSKMEIEVNGSIYIIERYPRQIFVRKKGEVIGTVYVYAHPQYRYLKDLFYRKLLAMSNNRRTKPRVQSMTKNSRRAALP